MFACLFSFCLLLLGLSVLFDSGVYFTCLCYLFLNSVLLCHQFILKTHFLFLCLFCFFAVWEIDLWKLEGIDFKTYLKTPSSVPKFVLLQVLKVSSDGRDGILLELGEAFTPGSDVNHFCQPTDVAVDAETGDIFVSDGYCNARILKFSANGRYLSQWGAGI